MFGNRDKTKVLPTSIIVRRNDPRRDRHNTPQTNEWAPVIIQPETAPKPVDSTSFYGVGRDPRHAWPHVWVYQALAIQDKLSIRSWEAAGDPLVQKIPSALVVNMPVGQFIPAGERTNIKMPENTAYGSLASLNPSPSWSPGYGKITP